MSILKDISKKNYIELEDNLYEFADKNEIKKYSDIIWYILQFSYKKIGGFFSFYSKENMEQRISKLVVYIKNKKIICCAIYRSDNGGYKLVGCGTLAGMKYQKEYLKDVIKNDINNVFLFHWCEVSKPLEYYFREYNGNPVPSKFAYRMLHKRESEIIPVDIVHYKRLLNHDYHIKCIYGFNSQKNYNKLMSTLEEYCEFKSYDEFKNYVNNGLPDLLEGLAYQDNDNNDNVALAMETIIQIDNFTSESGFDMITPHMKQYIESAIDILENNKKSGYIETLIDIGKQILKLDIIELHTYNIQQYVIYPIK